MARHLCRYRRLLLASRAQRYAVWAILADMEMLIDSEPPASRRRGNGGHGPNPAQPPHETSAEGSIPLDNKRGLTPSSSRPPPSHPILKKSRGPSASGPRPTARFASPPTTSEEAIHDAEVATASPAAATIEMPPPPRPSAARKQQANAPTAASLAAKAPGPPAVEPIHTAAMPAAPGAEMGPPPTVSSAKGAKGAATGGRKIVANTAASRRKPVMVRRPSSQSSTGSDSGPQATGVVVVSKRSGSRRSTPTASQLLGPGPSSSQTSDPDISAKAAGKRPAKAPTGKRSTSRSVPAQVDSQLDEAVAARQLLRPASPQRRSTWDVKDSLATTVQQPSGFPLPAPAQVPPPPPVAGFVADQAFGHGAPTIVRSRSKKSEAPQLLREPGVALLPSQATSSVATFTTTARGQFDSEIVTAEPVVPEARDIPDQVLFGSHQTSSVLDQHFKPTPPNPTPPIPYGRSKSELTLLLARGTTAKDEDD
jgi:hypothetical protein